MTTLPYELKLERAAPAEVARCLRAHGVVWIRELFPKALIERALAAAIDAADTAHRHTVAEKRHLIHLPLTGVFLDESLIAASPILDALIAIVGNSRRIMLSAYGVVMTEPGAPAQPAHPDYRGAEELAFTIGIPLSGGGTTRFQARGEAEFVALPYEPGDGLAWDFCTFHGGEPHTGPERRFLLYAAFTSPFIIDPNVTLTGMPRLNVRPAEVLRSSDRVFGLFQRYLGELSRAPLWLDALAELPAPTSEVRSFFDAVAIGGITDLARTLEIASRCGLSPSDAIEALRSLARTDRLRDVQLSHSQSNHVDSAHLRV